MNTQELLTAAFRTSRRAIVIERLSDRRLVEANLAFEHLSGYSRDELLGRSLAQLGLWATPDEYNIFASELLRSGDIAAYKTSFRRKSGDLGEMRLSAHVLDAGPERYVVAMLADITETAVVDKAVREREALLSMFVEHVPAAVAMLDKDLRYIMASQRWIEDFSLQRQNLRGKHYHEVFPNLTADCKAINHRALAGEVVREDGYRFVRADGSVRCLRLEERPWYTDDGSIGGIVIFSEDISERQHASDALRESEARFRGIFEQAAVGMALVAQDGRWLRINHQLCDMVGYDESELRGIRFQDITHPDDIADDEDRVARLQAQPDSVLSFEKRYQHKSGRIVWANVTATLLRDNDGVPSYFIAVIEDITERKEIDIELANLRRKLDDMTRFHVASHTVAALAHEINQPLNAVSSYAEAALQLLKGGNPQPEKLRHAIEKSAQQAQRAGRVVHNLLAFLRHGEVQREAIDINDLARKVVKHAKAIGHGPIRFSMNLDSDLPAVHANRLQVQKVLTNLIDNGIEAMHYAGSARTAIAVTVRTNTEGSMAQVTVIDSGPGIDSDLLHRVFDTFFTTKPNGLGVGLSISRTIIEAHGGRLWAESAPGTGASFHFTLPFVP